MRFGASYAELKKDTKNRIALLQELKALDKESITAGIHKSEGRQTVGESGTKLIDIAVQNEYGNEWTMPKTVCFQKNGKWYAIKRNTHIKIPATHFIGRMLTDTGERRALLDDFKAGIHMVLKGIWKSSDAVKSSGAYMRDRLKSFIDKKIFTSNSPMTIEVKGFDK